MAEDAAVAVEIDPLRAGVDRLLLEKIGEARREHPVTIGQGLKFAVPALFADGAEVVPFDEEHFDDGLAHVLDVRGGVLDDHAVGHRLGAGRGEAAVYTHRAYPAAAGRLEALEVAEGRDVDAAFHGGLENGLSRLNDEGLAVYVDVGFSHVPAPLSGRRGRPIRGRASWPRPGRSRRCNPRPDLSGPYTVPGSSAWW